jgi:hypothetical protein
MQRQRALTAHSFYTACPVCSEPPGRYRFNSHPIDEAPAMLVDRATVSCWGLVRDPEEGPRAAQHTYRVHDGVLLALERPGHENDDMLWAFVASSERQGLFDVCIGDVVERTPRVTASRAAGAQLGRARTASRDIPERWPIPLASRPVSPSSTLR